MLSASPGAAAALLDINRDLDLRHVLPAIRVSMLVLHAVGDPTIDVPYGRYMAARIPGAHYVELPGADHLPWLADAEAIGAEIERFVGESDAAVEPDRVRGNGAKAAPQTGPVMLATFDGPARAVRCASAIVEGARRRGMVAKAGLHTGECHVQPEGLRGAVLDVARRAAAVAKGGDVIVSATVRDLVAGSGIAFLPRATLATSPAAERRPLFSVAAPAAAVLGAGAAI